MSSATTCNNNRPSHNNPGERSSQYAAEASCRERFGSSTEWMTFIDIDEYMVPMQNDTWRPLLKEMTERDHVNVLKMRSSRGLPRMDLMEPLRNETQRATKCQYTSHRKHPLPLSSCLVPRRNETILRVYNCQYVKPPLPDRFSRAMKQIFRPAFVQSHFVHYSTVTRDMAMYHSQKPDHGNYTRKIQDYEW